MDVYSGLKYIDDSASEPSTPPGSPTLANSTSIPSNIFINSDGPSPWPDSTDSGSPTPRRPDSPDPRNPPISLSLKRSFALLNLDELDREWGPKEKELETVRNKYEEIVFGKKSSSMDSIPARPKTPGKWSIGRSEVETPESLSSTFSSDESSLQESEWESKEEKEDRRRDREMQKRTRRATSAQRARREEELTSFKDDEDLVPETQREWLLPALPTDEIL